MSEKTSDAPPETASCAIPLIVLGAVIVLLFVAFPISSALIGDPMREIEDSAVKQAVTYIQSSEGADTDFGKRMGESVGGYKRSRVVKIGTEKGKPPTIYVTLVVEGSKGEGIATVELQDDGGGYEVQDALIVKQ